MTPTIHIGNIINYAAERFALQKQKRLLDFNFIAHSLKENCKKLIGWEKSLNFIQYWSQTTILGTDTFVFRPWWDLSKKICQIL